MTTTAQNITPKISVHRTAMNMVAQGFEAGLQSTAQRVDHRYTRDEIATLGLLTEGEAWRDLIDRNPTGHILAALSLLSNAGCIHVAGDEIRLTNLGFSEAERLVMGSALADGGVDAPQT